MICGSVGCDCGEELVVWWCFDVVIVSFGPFSISLVHTSKFSITNVVVKVVLEYFKSKLKISLVDL